MTGELRNHHLKKTWDFQRILKGREKVYNENFVVFYQKNSTHSEVCRFGISIPQRIVKRAVLRNKCKRQIKSILLEMQREKLEGWKKFKEWDFLIIIKEKFIVESFETKSNSLKHLFKFFNWKINNKNSLLNKTLPRKHEKVHKHFEKSKDKS